MKKIISCIFALLLGASLFANGFAFGIEGGVGPNSATIILADDNESDLDLIPGYYFGSAVEYSFNDILALQTKVLFHQRNGFAFTDSSGTTKISFMTIDVPLLLKMTFTGIDTIPGRFSIIAGSNFSFRIGDIKESHGGFTGGARQYKWDDIFAAGIVAGAEYSFSKVNGFTIGFTTVIDFTDFAYDSDFEMHRFSVMPYIGYWF